MKPRSDLRARMLWSYRESGRAYADYFEDVFNRWVRVYGPDITCAPREYSNEIVWQSHHAKRFFFAAADVLKNVASRIEDAICHDATCRAFRSRVYSHSDFMVFYIRGNRYAIVGRPAQRRAEEILLCLALLAPQGIRETLEVGLEKIAIGQKG